jgi:3-hydroxyisobutyrate dehydrogenase-like beta-hydroxyacid dehydrogenase
MKLGIQMKEKIGFIGLGLMGSAMATKLLSNGYQLFVFNRTKEKAAILIDKGAQLCASPAEVASQTGIIFSMISTPKVLEEISLGSSSILSTLQKGAIHIDCSTVSPVLTKNLERNYREKNCYFIHSPVLGGVAQINTGSLLLFIGGNLDAIKSVISILNIFSSKYWLFEDIEQATTTKLICNSMLAGMSTLLAQSFVLAEKTGIPSQTLLEIIEQSQLAAPMYKTKGTAMIERNFSPKFYVEHILKDLNLVLDVAKSQNAHFPIGLVAQDLYLKAIEYGFAKEDYSSVLKVFETISGIEPEKVP